MKNYCCTDLHGMYDLWTQIRDYCEDDSKIYFLGDACDRGPDGIKIIQELLNDPRVIYLQGNHEDMFINAILTIDSHDIFTSRFMMTTWLANGGGSTYDAFMKLPKQEQKKLIKKLRELPYVVNKDNQKLILCHAGFSPTMNNINTYDLLWDRNHIVDSYEKAFNDKYKDVYVVHGHTPVINFNHYKHHNHITTTIYEKEKVALIIGKESLITGVTRYCGNQKIDLDLGSFITKTTVLFDLDELKVVKYFIERG